MRHPFAIHLLEPGSDIPTEQDLSGHADVTATMFCINVPNIPGLAAKSQGDAVKNR